LHHEAKSFSLPAVKKIVFFTTKERKSMSTKTSLKRIALVAVSALTGGLFSLVTAPMASATAGLVEIPTSVAAGTPGVHRAGVTGTTEVVLNMGSAFAIGDSVVVSARILTAPATSKLVNVAANPTQSAWTGISNSGGTYLTWSLGASGSSGSYGSLGSVVHSTEGNATASAAYVSATGDTVGQLKLRVSFTPDVSGTYSILVSSPNTAALARTSTAANYTAGTSSSDISTTFVVTTANTAATATLAAVTSAARSGSAVRGQLMKLTLADSAGAASTLGSGEQIVLSSNDTSVSFAAPAAAVSSSATTMTVTSASTGWVGSTFYFRVDNSSTTDESVTITATAGGTLSSAVTANVGTSFTAAASTAAAATVGKDTVTPDDSMAASTTATGVDCSALASTDKCFAVSPADSSHTLRATVAAAVAYKTYWTVTDTSGKITGFQGAIYTVPVTFASTDTVLYKDTAITAALLVTGSGSTYQSFQATLFATSSPTVTVKAAAAASDSMSVTDSNRRVAVASTNTFTATLLDQYGAARANRSVTVTVAGRNGATASSTVVTNADGEVSYSLTDTGTVGTTDTITFADGSVTASATVTYGTTTVTTLSVTTTAHVTAGVLDTNITYDDKVDINASSKAGASASTSAVTVTAKDANAVNMSGVPVTFSVAGTGCGILTTKTTQYTGAAGTATTNIYAWLETKCTVTATAGGQTVTTDVYFAQKGADEARTITAAAVGGLVTATVKDRFGNPIKGVYVYATRTGTGYFGTGTSSTSGQTNEAGQVEFFVNGDATVTVQLGNSTGANAEFGQSSSDAGKYGTKSATQTAFTASADGTATTAQTGVGASLAPAGINSAEVKVSNSFNAAQSAADAAADAAAEAIDAANAATDAANLAAEAADAATVAAEEARDAADAATAAVEELATQVATLMAALKAQITTLANTVAKIAKKVKA
jgi:hypothetical protein